MADPEDIEALQRAIRYGDFGNVQSLMKYVTCQVVSPEKNENCVLELWVGRSIHERAIRMLIQAGYKMEYVKINGESPLLYAIDRSKLDIIKSLVNEGSGMFWVNIGGRGALEYAVDKGNGEVVKMLIEASDKITFVNIRGATALRYAIEKRNLPMVKALVNINIKGAKNIVPCARKFIVDEKGEGVIQEPIRETYNMFTVRIKGKNALEYAVEKENVEVIKTLVDAVCKLESVNIDGSSVLNYAVRKRDLSMVKTLLKAKFKVKRKDFKGAVMYAIDEGSAEILLSLVEHGCDLSVVQIKGVSALDYAITKDNTKVIEILIEAGCNLESVAIDESNVLHNAIVKHSLPMVKALLHAKCKVQTEHIQCALQYAVGGRSSDILEALVQTGCDLSTLEVNGMSALEYAIRKDNSKVIEIIVETGCNLESVTIDESNVLQNAIEKHSVPMVEALLKAKCKVEGEHIQYALENTVDEETDTILDALLQTGCDVSTLKIKGKSALEYVIKRKRDSVAKALIKTMYRIYLTDVEDEERRKAFEELIKGGFGVSAGGYAKRMALFAAVESGCLWVVDLFIKIGYVLSAADTDGRNALHLAAANCKLDVVKMLLEAGCDVNAEDKKGKTALDYAVDSRFTEGFVLLIEAKTKMKLRQIHADSNVNQFGAGSSELHVHPPDAAVSKEPSVSLVNPREESTTNNQQPSERASKETRTVTGNGSLTSLAPTPSLESGKHLTDNGIDVKNSLLSTTCADTSDRPRKTEHVMDTAGSSGLDIHSSGKCHLACSDKTMADPTVKNDLPHDVAEKNLKTGHSVKIQAGFPWLSLEEVAFCAFKLILEKEKGGKMIEILMKINCNLESVKINGQSPLQFAIDHDIPDIVKELLNWRGDLLSVNISGRNLMEYAIDKGSAKVVNILINATDSLKFMNIHGSGALQNAIEKHNLSMVKALLKGKCKVEPEHIQRALECAVDEDTDKIIEALLQTGCDVSTVKIKGKSALEYATKRKREGIAKALIKAMYRIYFADVEDEERRKEFEELIERGFGVSAAEYAKRMALFVAVESGCLWIVDLFIKCGHDLSTVDKEGRNALHLAAAHCKISIVDKLLKAGCDVRAVDLKGQTALDYASASGFIDGLLVLTEAKRLTLIRGRVTSHEPRTGGTRSRLR